LQQHHHYKPFTINNSSSDELDIGNTCTSIVCVCLEQDQSTGDMNWKW